MQSCSNYQSPTYACVFYTAVGLVESHDIKKIKLFFPPEATDALYKQLFPSSLSNP